MKLVCSRIGGEIRWFYENNRVNAKSGDTLLGNITDLPHEERKEVSEILKSLARR